MRSSPFCAVFVTLASCQSGPEVRPLPPPPQLQEQRFDIVAQTLTDVAVTFSGTVQGTSEPMTIEKAVYELVVEQQVLATREKVLGLTLAANAAASFTIDERLTYVKDEGELKAMDARGGSLLMALRGRLVMHPTASPGQRLEVEFARSRDVRTPRLPHLKLLDWEAGRFSETEVQLVFHLGVTNPNPFPLSLQGIDYALTMAGRPITQGTLGAGERVVASSTGVFDVNGVLNEETHGKDTKKVIKALVLPFELTGALRTVLFSESLSTRGEVKLSASK
jgi:Late embryogenesis abundant protein